ncbi:MAG: TIGR01621 family pseudouridine synthase, partial [Chitinispirillaceae bacterium]
MYKLISIEKEFLIISKHENVSFHKDQNRTGLVQKIRNDLQLDKLYPVHRLDRMTSGLLLFALNKTTAAELSNQFAQGNVEKFYVALAGNKPKKKQGTVMGDMCRSRNGTWKLSRTRSNPAITTFKSISMSPGIRTFLLRPLTGKTHQLRVAMKSLGVPVLGDPLYFPAADNTFDRGYLHAFGLEFTLKERRYTFTEMPYQGRLFGSEEFRRSFESLEDTRKLMQPTGRGARHLRG